MVLLKANYVLKEHVLSLKVIVIIMPSSYQLYQRAFSNEQLANGIAYIVAVAEA